MKIVTVLLISLISLPSFAQVKVPQRAIMEVVSYAAKKHNISPKVIVSIMWVESKFDINATGKYSEVGLMQLYPRYFPAATHDISTNIMLGVEHLAFMKKYCPNKKAMTWVNCYNKGFKKLKYPKQFPYYRKFIEAYSGK